MDNFDAASCVCDDDASECERDEEKKAGVLMVAYFDVADMTIGVRFSAARRVEEDDRR